MSSPKDTRRDEDRQWFLDQFAAASQLESRLIPDITGAEPCPPRKAVFPLPVPEDRLQALRKAFPEGDEALFGTAFGLTLSVWSADTKACFSLAWGEGPESPVYMEWTPDQPVRALVEALARQIEGVRKHDGYTGQEAAGELELDRSMLLRGPGAAGDLRDGADLVCCWAPDGVTVLYRPDKYSEELLGQFARSLCACLCSMDGAGSVRDLSFATQEQVAEVEGFNPPPVDFDIDLTLLDLFRENVSRYPDHPAVVYKGTLLTYAQLDALTDRLAARIAETVSPGGVVSIILNRNEYMVVAPLAVLKAGCAYQPLDPSYPTERLSFMVQDAKAGLLIADPGLETRIGGYDGPVLSTPEIPLLPEGKPGVPAPKPDERFILLYTSGTTGVPKGVQLSHRNIAAYARSNARALGIGPDSRTAAYASFGFDASMGDLVTAMASGAALYIIPDELRLDLPALDAYFAQNGITHTMMTTQVATQFALNFPESKTLQVLYTGGEKLASFTPPAYRLVNIYGPTETTVYTVSKTVSELVPDVPIGKPLSGVRAYVAGKGGQRLPVGAAGELLLSGPQVGMGYLGRPDKTAEVFVDNPYCDDPAYRHMYRTGDIVRFRSDGDIQFIGRRDMQVKIRGFRIELKEVESVIREFPGISDATVQAFDEEGEGAGKFLAAYIVGEGPVDIDALNAFILERKPPYMVPAVTMQIDAIPLNINQKVDRKALPKPEKPQREKPAEEAAPFNVLEQEIAGIIAETAHIEVYSLTEPLAYAGLTSLSGLRLATELYKRYGISPDMKAFAKTASLQSIENEVLASLLSGHAPATAEGGASEAGPVSLTFQQEGLYFECMKNPSETVYNLPMMWTLPATLDPGQVREAFLQVVRCHPALMSRFDTVDGKAQLVPVPGEPDMETLTLTDADLAAFKADFLRPFNLSEGPLFRAALVRSGSGLYLFTDFHHLVFDGRSLDVFMSEFCAAVDGTEPVPESYTYFDYAADQKAAEGGREFAAAEAFFRERMEGFENASALLPDLEKTEGAGSVASLEMPLGAEIGKRCLALGISPASFCLAAASLTVGTFCGSRKVFLCTVSNGRSDLQVSDTVGMFVNTLALAGEIRNGDVADYLKETDRIFSESRAHEYYPFSKVSSDYGFQPQVMLAYQVGLLEEYKAAGKALACEDLAGKTPMFPVSIFVNGTDGPESLQFQYDETLYSRELMQSFADTLNHYARQLLDDGKVEDLTPSDARQQKLLDGFNAWTLPVDDRETVVSLFRRQAAATPEAPAVQFEGKVLTYGALDEMTDRLAARIASFGLGRENVVSVLIGRSEMMAVASLGALKAGCAYQPLDPSYPEERLNFMIADASAKLLVSEARYRPLITGYDGPELDTAEIAGLPAGPLPEGPAPEDLFILLYTSGSTGVPKGCMLEHRNLVNFCAWYRNYYSLTPDSRVAAYASYGFDACMMDLYPALTTGACVCIIPEDTRHDMSDLDRFITENGVTHSFMTTQVAVMFARNYPDNPSLKHLSAGGEKLVSIDPPSYAFHNGYGPTECTIFSTIYDVTRKEANIPIGHPLDNLRLYVVDPATGRRLPAGAVGELWISGPQVSRGYLNRPEKTAETFIANPFESEHPYDRVYRTGDIVRYRMDGNIEFVGRNDGQVKIRGFRVETKEVEAVIREFPGVQDVTVQPFDNPSGGKFIAAYVVCDGDLDTKALSDFILRRKPPYMVPAAFAKLDRIPLNVNQKVDRKALPAPVMSSNETYVEPEGPTEKALCEIFEEILGAGKVGATDNFFDLGGSSLMVTSVLVSAEKRGLKFSYGDVFNNPTPRALAQFLGDGGEKPKDDRDDVYGYDYSAIDRILQGNTLEAFRTGEPQELGRNILLTGATGFLGIHVLRELIERTPDDAVIWCLLRGKGSISAERRLAEMLVYYFEKNYRPLIGKRIRLIQGDITQESVFDAILTSGTPIDLVVNCAANVKHFSQGDDIMQVNYHGVRNLVGFCQARSARLVQVSTVSVGGMTEGSVPRIMDEQTLFFGQNTDNQYIVSKFLAERLILEKVAEGKLNAKIIRVGNLSPRAEDGEFQINFNSNASMGRLKAFRLLGAAPYPTLEARMEFSPIDETARAVVLLAGTPRKNVVFHVQNDHLLPMDDIFSRLRKEDGSPLEYVEEAEFARRMDAAKDDPDMARILSSIIAYTQAEGQTQLVENEASSLFSMQVLHRLGFRWDPTSSQYVDMVFDMLSSMRYFED
ncbi:MAG: amino acid adenylation domain-containing protein [Bacteroidales bacterium]|nr:amino acid adenylation domain-containing protein [Bacteroidales bacterium]